MRTPQVAEQLDNYLRQQVADNAPFSWGSNNCGHFISRWWELATNDNPIADFDMPQGPVALRRYFRRNQMTLAYFVSTSLQRNVITPKFAQVGDVVMHATAAIGGLGFVLGICCGRFTAQLSMDGKITYVETLNGLDAWPINNKPFEAL